MTRRHDADLCERIRELEKRVEELEAQPRTIVYPALPHYCWIGCPQHHPTWYPTWTSPNTSGITISSGTTQTAPGGTQFTYTVGDIS